MLDGSKKVRLKNNNTKGKKVNIPKIVQQWYLMAGNQDPLSSDDDDDDLILQLSTRPPRTSTQPQLTVTTALQPHQDGSSQEGNLMNNLLKAQGEASMLRDKISFLTEERKREKQWHAHNNEKLKSSYAQEFDKVKVELQNLEDEKKFLLMEIKKASSAAKSKTGLPASSSNTDIPSSADEITATEHSNSNVLPLQKKRKVIDLNPKKSYVCLNSIRTFPDETAEFLDFLLLHKIVGAELSTLEILNRLNLDYIEDFAFNSFTVSKGESIGKSLMSLLLQCKKTMTLDRYIDTLLESIAVLIKEISLHKQESNLAVPFLVAIMYQAIIFRPSAVHKMALKDLFYFTCDLIKAYQHVLKQPLHESALKLHVEPQIFQYELIDILVVLYSFDMLESSLRILRSHSAAAYSEILDSALLSSLEYIYKLALTISHKPIVNVIFNTVEILNLLSCMLVSSPSQPVPIDCQWWKDCITRLYHILGKDIKNSHMFSDDSSNTFYFSRFHDCYGLVRNLGTNTVGGMISDLIFKDKLQGVPKVISKDDIPAKDDLSMTFHVNLELERLLLQLKDNILNLLDNILIVYSNDSEIINGEMLIHLTRSISKEQELLIERYVGQDSTNSAFRCHMIEHTLSIIYRLWVDHQKKLGPEQIKEIESELIMALWRIIVSQDYIEESVEMGDHRHLVDKMHELQLKDQASYYDDALEDMPDYIHEELKGELDNRTAEVMQVRYDESYQYMARTILESKLETLTSIEDIDSLYLAMGM